ncbi:MAG: LLM class flavin-dependent oxidoreductase [Spongiibacteraceae bacterium]
MKFGFVIPHVIDRGARNPFHRIHRHVAAVEAMGFEFGTLGHHRFTPQLAFGEPSAPLTTLAAILARTERVKVCTSILLLPTYHPLDIAEQIGTLDEMSNGRVILGIGAGYRPYEFAAVGIDFKTRMSRMEEMIAVLRQAWTGNPVNFHGRHFQIDNVTVSPRPQQNHLPIWIGASAPNGIDRAAIMSDGWIAGFPTPLPILEPIARDFRAKAAAAGQQGTVCLMRDFHIAASRDRLDPEWMQRSIGVYRNYLNAGSKMKIDDTVMRAVNGENISFDEYIPGRAVAGTPEDCIREIERCRTMTGCEYMLLTPVGVPDVEQQLRELELFSREVMPHFSDPKL